MHRLLKEIFETPDFIERFEQTVYYAVPKSLQDTQQCTDVAGCAYCNSRQSEMRLIRHVEELIDLIVAVSEIHDPYTINHEKSSGDLAGAIATEMGLPLFDVAGVIVAGYMHDVGKVAIPTEILTKPGKLSPEELGLVKTHPIYGYRLLSTITLPWNIANAALMHHERLDGSGYPRGLKGIQISQTAQIIAVADVAEAMRSTRPYRVALPTAEIIDHFEQNKGILYNLDASNACINMLATNKY